MNRNQRLAFYTQALRGLGYAPKIENGDVVFEIDGGIYVVGMFEDDANYVELTFPNFWKFESEDERVIAYIAANRVNASLKAVKVFVRQDGNDTMAAVDLFGTPEQIVTQLARAIAVLQQGVQLFALAMSELSAPDWASDWPDQYLQ